MQVSRSYRWLFWCCLGVRRGEVYYPGLGRGRIKPRCWDGMDEEVMGSWGHWCLVWQSCAHVTSTTDDTWMQGLWAEMFFSMRCLQRDLFKPRRTSLHFASTEQPLWMLEQGWDPERAQPGIRDGLSVSQMCMCSGLMGILSKALTQRRGLYIQGLVTRGRDAACTGGFSGRASSILVFVVCFCFLFNSPIIYYILFFVTKLKTLVFPSDRSHRWWLVSGRTVEKLKTH